MSCSRCGRNHSGICGIPGIGVRLGMGVRLGVGASSRPIRRSTGEGSFPIKTKSKAPSVTKTHLEHLLRWGQGEEQKCLEMIKHLPPEMKEYTDLLERLDKLSKIIPQIKIQLLK